MWQQFKGLKKSAILSTERLLIALTKMFMEVTKYRMRTQAAKNGLKQGSPSIFQPCFEKCSKDTESQWK